MHLILWKLTQCTLSGILLTFTSFCLTFTHAANLAGAWDIELQDATAPNSCAAHGTELQTAYDEAAEMIDAATTSMALIADQRPRLTRSTQQAVSDWNRGARLFTAIFGAKFDHTKGPADADNTALLQTVQGVYSEMNDVFTSGQPFKGHTGKFAKPAIACGDAGWAFIAADSEDIGDPAKRPLSQSKSRDGQPEFPNGAWYWKQRYFFGPTSTAQVVGICGDNVNGVTQVAFDMITFCDSVWGNPTLQAGKDSAQADVTTLDAIFQRAVSRTVVHELAHYFGFGGGQNLPDHQAVNHQNQPFWINAAGTARTVKNPNKNLKKALTYFFTDCINMARFHPDQAVNTAETFSYFSAGAFASNFDWSQGIAQTIPPLASELVARVAQVFQA